MRLGGPAYGDCSTPEKWIATLRKHGYTAAYCPVNEDADGETIRAYAQAAKEAHIVIAEVGAWSNPLSADEATRKAAIALCQKRLALADEIGAACCVNIVGSRGEQWDGPHEDNFRSDTFDLIVETVREIVDAARPARTFYTLETMPWMMPDSPENYLHLLKAIDRKQCAAHLDPVNMICSPRLYYGNGDFLRECFRLLGPYIKSCHAKDVVMSTRFTTHIDEVRPGLGTLDYATFLTELSRLPTDTPIMVEHLPSEEEYALAVDYIRSIGRNTGLTL